VVDDYLGRRADGVLISDRLYMKRSGGLFWAHNAKWDGTNFSKDVSPEHSYSFQFDFSSGGIALALGKDPDDADTLAGQLNPDAVDSVAHILRGATVGNTKFPTYRQSYDDPALYARVYEPSAPAIITPMNQVVAWSRFRIASSVITNKESYGIADINIVGGGFHIELVYTNSMVHIGYGFVFGINNPNPGEFHSVSSDLASITIKCQDGAGADVDLTASTVEGTIAIIGQQA
jgi:hypothetical protein